MRQQRSRKFRKRYKSILICIQILTVWYLLILTGIQLNSYTNAAFNDIEEVTASLHVNWDVDEDADNDWDKSSLDFDKPWLKRGGACNPPYLYAEIYNDGEDMTHSVWRWELYQVSNAKNIIGSVLESGIINPIASSNVGKIETTDLKSLPGEGTYRFKVLKPDRPGNDVIWSEPIKIKGCSPKSIIEVEVAEPEIEPEEKTGEAVEKLDEIEQNLDTKHEEGALHEDGQIKEDNTNIRDSVIQIDNVERITGEKETNQENEEN